MTTLMSEFGANLARALEAKNGRVDRQGIETSAETAQGTERETTADNPDAVPHVERAAPVFHEGRMDNKEATLVKIETVTGPLRAYDGRYCVWGSNGPFDVRDVARRIDIDVDTVADAIPEFKPVKRGKRGDDDHGSDSPES